MPDASGRPVAEIAVIGGGVIGMTAALRLAREGREVLLVEPNDLGSGASHGNAGTIADYAVLPVANPAVLRSLPALFFDSDSPLSLRFSALPGLAPWLLRFLVNCRRRRTEANGARLAGLLADAVPLWFELAREIGAFEHLHRNGCLYVFDTKNALRNAESDAEFRRRHGVELEILGPREVAQLEPELPEIDGGAHYFPNAVNIDDPGAVMKRLGDTLAGAGVPVVRAKATRIELLRGGQTIHCDTGAEISARRTVIAAGAHSQPLAAQLGDTLPLDTERGYHIEYDMATAPVRRVVCSAARGFYAVPMAGRLRIAGTVELAGLGPPANPRRYAMLERGAGKLFPTLGAPDRKWLGFRPSMPDSIPVIRPSRHGKDVILAFGHGHLGLTLAPATAKAISGLIEG